ncbi:uncharacterized protein LOC125238848 [Leguminivora glycinivorella]|uniref:uncharacterized protein LOC125238848 n=1 Tax=Leguminivora glycinivorella TaxID=1035111 RepID=UPI00200DE95E|nr:uncharacterized protein LOC125238848 [Leguminivora glycinivorella]
MSSKDDGKGAEPDPQNGKRCSLSSESSDGSSSSSEGETPPPNKRPRKTRGEFPQVMYDPRVDTLTSQVSYISNYLIQSQTTDGVDGEVPSRDEDSSSLVPPRINKRTIDIGEISTEIKEGTVVQTANPVNLKALEKLQKFNSPAWQAVRYKNSLKTMLAKPGFVELGINEELMHFNKGKDYLASTENVLAGLSNAVLTNRCILKRSLQELADWSTNSQELNSETLYEKVSSIFGSGSEIYKNYETTLQIIAGKRTECIEIRRNRILNEVTNPNLKASLKNLPPSNEHLFSREAMAPLIQSLGGTQVWLNTPNYIKEKKIPSANTNKQPEKVKEYDNSSDVKQRTQSENQSSQTHNNNKHDRKHKKQSYRQNKTIHFNKKK